MNSSNVEGAFDEAKGKVKQAVGEATGDQSLANSGAADQVKGNVKETWGNVKDSANTVGNKETANATEQTQHDGHSIRESVTSTAANVKDSIKRGIDHLEHKSNS